MSEGSEGSATKLSRAPAFLVGLGILASRITGLVRQSVFAHYFGTSEAAAAFSAALKIPNFLQNLFGEGVLSASFIPVYAGLRSRGQEQEADRAAGAVASLVALLTAVIVLAGMLATPLLVELIAGGLNAETKALTVRLVRILFPGVGLLVLSAWCLGVLNSHGRFLLSYAAPVLWNGAIIVALVAYGRRTTSLGDLAVITAWGAVIGSALQLAVQIPSVWKLAPGLRFAIDTASAQVRTVARNFGPVFVGRGVVQISGLIDLRIASAIGAAALASVSYAQVLYMLPVSLFGMAVSAAELPAMSRAQGDETAIASQLRARLERAVRHMALFVIPSMVAFLALGDVIAAALFQRGRFTAADTNYVWGILAGAAVGLLGATLARLYASTFYALGDTKNPLRFAIVRVVLGTVLGVFFALYLPDLLGIDPLWGATGLTLAGGLVAWVEFALLRGRLGQRIGSSALSGGTLGKLMAAALIAAAAGYGIKLAVADFHPVARAVLVLGPFGLLYFALASAFGVGESRDLVGRILTRIRGRSK